MTLHLARQANTCTGNKQWYVCSKGNFHGCCSVDPCNTGVCPDQGSQTTWSTATTATMSKTASTTTASSPTAAITTAPSTSSQGDIPGIIPTRTVTQAVAPATDTADASPGNDHAALIGGVVGGVLALILLSGLLFLVYRSRKKHGKRFVLLGWRVPRGESDEKASAVASSRGLGSGNEGRLLDVPNHNTPSHAVVNQALTVPGSEPTSATSNTISTPSTYANTNTNTNTSKISAPAETTNHSSLSSLPPASAPSTTSHHSPDLNLSASTNTNTSPHLHPPAPASDTADTDTPELSDTGFYRQRAELAAYSQSELINIPPERRQLALPAQHQHQHTNSDPGTDQSTQPSLPSIITPDGVILAANFDYRVSGDDPYPVPGAGSGSGEGMGHVLSFMRFEEGAGAGRGKEWRRSFEGGMGV